MKKGKLAFQGLSALIGLSEINAFLKTGRWTDDALKAFSKLPLNFKGMPKFGTIDPKKIKFSQGSIKADFKDGKPIEALTNGLKNGTTDPKSVPAARIVEKDGQIFTLDNRRLKAFQDAGVDIKYEKLDEIPSEEMFKFRDYDKGKTDGTTIKVRGKN